MHVNIIAWKCAIIGNNKCSWKYVVIEINGNIEIYSY